jgi:glyoxylase-like metal-dependent hydrolase (beta-lactamase superfamily II)
MPAGAQGPGSPFTLKQVAPGVYAAIDRDARSGANAGFVIGDDGVAIIDSFQFPEAADSLLAAIRRLTPLPVRYVINTHYHIDHVVGNAVFMRAGALAVAHRNVAAWIGSENLKFLPADSTRERARIQGLPIPDLLVDRELSIRLGGRRLELRVLPGHSGSDLVVAVPDAKVLFTGDLFWRQVAPSLVDATVSSWIETLRSLRRRTGAAEYTYVPGQGAVAGLADIGDFQGYLENLTATVGNAVRAGVEGVGLVAAALPSIRARYGGWLFFDTLAPQQIPHMAAELAGSKRLPPSSATGW